MRYLGEKEAMRLFGTTSVAGWYQGRRKVGGPGSQFMAVDSGGRQMTASQGTAIAQGQGLDDSASAPPLATAIGPDFEDVANAAAADANAPDLPAGTTFDSRGSVVRTPSPAPRPTISTFVPASSSAAKKPMSTTTKVLLGLGAALGGWKLATGRWPF